MFRAIVRLVIFLALATAVLWVGLPVAAAAVARAAIGSSDLQADDVQVSVAANPPLKLLLLEADSIRIQATHATWRGLVASRIDVTLHGLRLGGSPETIDGRLDSVAFTDAAGVTVTADSMAFSGAAASPSVEVRLAALEVAALVGRVWPAGPNAAGAIVGLAPPDGVRISTAQGEVVARLRLTDDGSLVLALSGPGVPALQLTILQPGPSLAVHLDSATVDGAFLVLRGTVDARSLGL